MMKRLALTFPLLLVVAFAVGCARQGYPSGGPKDETPPQVVGSKPTNESRNFKGKQFYVEFDEYVVLKNAEQNVLVSPPMAQKPEYSTRGMGVVVRLRDTLQPNTTYLFQFKEAIADYTEGNLLPSYEYVFSTGEQMDSRMMAGQVLDARSRRPWDEPLTVLAFRPGDSVAALVTRTDKQGNFAFHYIPQGSYRIVALADKNRDLRIDSTEAVAWDEQQYQALDSIDSTALAHLRISTPDRRRQRTLKAEFTARGRIAISTLLPLQQPSLQGEPAEWRLNGGRDTMSVWCLNEACDSTVLVLTDGSWSDTLKLRYRPPSRRNRKPATLKEPIVKALCAGTAAYYDDLRLAFTNPVRPTSDTLQAEVMLLKDSSVSLCPLVLDSSGLTARLATPLRPVEQYRVRVAEGLFIDLYNHLSDSLNFTLTPKDYGTLSLHVDNRSGYPVVIEVLDSRDTVVQRQTLAGSGQLRFIHLAAAEYTLRAVIDCDGNGRWTPGDYLRGRQPEVCRRYGKKLQLREKWELEERWTLDKEE